MTPTEILANLEEIENVSRMACEAFKKRNGIPSSINWGSFGVKDVEYSISEINGERFVVSIGDCSEPNCVLRSFMYQFFLNRGYKNPPEFRFEW